jgi:hypothetical protein
MFLSDESGVVFALGKVLDQTTCPTDKLILSRAGLGSGRRVGEELLENMEERLGIHHSGLLYVRGLDENRSHEFSSWREFNGTILIKSTYVTQTRIFKRRQKIDLGRDQNSIRDRSLEFSPKSWFR